MLFKGMYSETLIRNVWIQERIMQDELKRNMTRISQELQAHCQHKYGTPSSDRRGYRAERKDDILLRNLSVLLEQSQSDKEHGDILIAEARADYAVGNKDHSCIAAMDAARTLAEANAMMRAAILVMQEIMQYAEKEKDRGRV